MSQEEIAVFADIPNQTVRDKTPEQIKEDLESIAGRNYDIFSPKKIQSRKFITLSGDSEYGARMGVVKYAIAQALYSSEDFARYLRGVASQEGQEVQEYQKKKGTILYSLAEVLGFVDERAKERQFAEKEVISTAYQDMAEVVTEIGQEFGNKGPEDVLRLAELNHFFSGKWNGSRLNLTFTDEKIRGYGVKLQQIVQRIWDAGTGEDTPNPLTQGQLMPVKY